MTVRDTCTLCGQPRSLRRGQFERHISSQAHLQAVAAWDRRHEHTVPESDPKQRQRAMQFLFGKAREAA